MLCGYTIIIEHQFVNFRKNKNFNFEKDLEFEKNFNMYNLVKERSSSNTGEWMHSINNMLAHGLEAKYDDDVIETIPKTEISESTNVASLFDSGAPASLLRCPVSTPLKRPCHKATVTLQALRKSFKDLSKKKIILNNMKQTILDRANKREEREHQLRLKHTEELHAQLLRHNEEKHNAELYILKLKSQLLEMEIEKFNK